jgi:RimJ/RimL family protein N-acetyltransferase
MTHREITELQKKLNVRIANEGDSDMLLSWRNNPITIKNSHNQEAVSEDKHRSWLKNTLNDPRSSLLIVSHGDLAVAVVRYDRLEQEVLVVYELSITVNPEVRGMGYGSAAIKLAQLIFLDNKIGLRKGPRPEKVIAEVYTYNLPSLKLVKSLGMKCVGKETRSDGRSFNRFVGVF